MAQQRILPGGKKDGESPIQIANKKTKYIHNIIDIKRNTCALKAPFSQ
ncbi:hypothetical protein KQS06HV_20149 [Klebsiella quasipneumoniae subsp. similipneumoniae]|jgi:hypothetical protein|nr:hypothetical protein KQS06HV_20149 [Klebsiella quasipneumoniae subsp. similipneumoniae]